MRRLPDESIDLVVTSPPYNLRSGGRCRGWPGYDGYGDDLPHDEYVAWQQECLREMHRVIKPTGAIFYNHAPRIHQGVQWRHEDILEPFDVRQTVIWHRAGGKNHNPHYITPSYEYIYVMAKSGFRVAPDWTMGDVWKMGQEKRRWIPEVPAFPVELPQNAIRATGAKVVLDCFMGSGTTAVAAVLEGADYIGIEQSDRYCAVARERVASIPPGGEPVEPPALYTKSRPEPGRTELGGNAGVVYHVIRERIEAAGRYEFNLSQVSLAQEIGMNLKTLRRAITRIRAAGALIISDRGSSTSYALPLNDHPVAQPAALVASIKSVPVGAENVHMDTEHVPVDVPVGAENVHMDTEHVPVDVPMGAENVHMDTEHVPVDVPMGAEHVHMDTEHVPMDVPMGAENVHMDTEHVPVDVPMGAENVHMDTEHVPVDVPVGAENVHMDTEHVPVDVPMGAENVHMDTEHVPMDAKNVHMDTPYRLTGTSLPVNAEDTEFKEPDRITGSDVPMDVHMDTPLVAGQRASPESDWPSESAPNPASAWCAVLGRLQLEMPREHFNEFLKPCVGYAWEDGDLVVATASAFVVEWLELPLHQAMAQEALARTLGQEDAKIIWRVLPSVVQANQEGNPTERELPREPPPEEPEYCPEHPQPQLRVRSRWYTAREISKANDDEIYYCKGGGNQCTWVYSVKEGCIWKELADEPLQQAGLRNAYHAKQYRRTQATRTHRGKSD